MSPQSDKLIEVHATELESIDEIVWFRPAEIEGEVFSVEHCDSFLQ